MTATPRLPKADGLSPDLAGALWMIAVFAVEDAFIKAATTSLPVGQVLMMFGAGGAAVFALLARARGHALVSRAALSVCMRVRMVFEVVGRLFHGLALAVISLSAATVIGRDIEI